MTGLFLLLLIPFIHYDTLPCESEVVNEFQFNNKFEYVVRVGTENKLSIKELEKKPPRKGNIITYDEIDIRVILSGVFLFFLLIVLMIGTFMDDEETNWNFKKCWSKACVHEVICEF